MKNGIRISILAKLATIFLIMAATTLTASAAISKKELAAKIELARAAYGTAIMSERITKNYLYKGNGIAIRQAKDEIKKSLEEFEGYYKLLDESIGNPKSKNLLTFMKMSFDELKDIIGQPYSLDNAQIALDLAATINEGGTFIAEDIKKSISLDDGSIFNGVRIDMESIAKYYMAYQAGIKDDNTIKLMKDTVDKAAKTIDNLSKNPKNSVSMNQTMSKVKRLWGVVYKFYLDIDKGGLPFIVYKTTKDLNKQLGKYTDEMMQIYIQERTSQ